MNTFIIDASVAVKWMIEEEHSNNALRYLDENIKRYAPDIIQHECLNAFFKKVDRNKITWQDAIESYQTLFLDTPPLELISIDQVWDRSLKLSIEISHPIYDCLYLATALLNNSIVVTADKAFCNKVKKSRYSKEICWIDEPLHFTFIDHN